VRRRLLQPPFTGQSANAQKARTYGQRLEELHRLLNATNVEPARKIYLEAIRRAPEDFRLHVNYAAFLEAIQDMAGAEAEWKEVQGLVPHPLSGIFPNRPSARGAGPGGASAPLAFAGSRNAAGPERRVGTNSDDSRERAGSMRPRSSHFSAPGNSCRGNRVTIPRWPKRL
jgi:hypothetical protein